MSRRFGRNQRRKLRAQLAEQAAKIDSQDRHARFETALRQDMKRENQEMRRVLADVIEFFGPHFAPLGVKTIKGEPRLPVSVPIYERLMAAPARYKEGLAATMEVVELVRVIVEVARDEPRFRRYVRLIVEGHGDMVYAVSEKELIRRGFDGIFLREFLAPQIAEKLAESMNRKLAYEFAIEETRKIKAARA